ncbi:YbaB/EbfC family nucleoid-associated protein [Amycolatopsis rubida]|uniref:YbaB/EbfC family nucleoid-associated protein n=1 Tax=Amycolatopsis rubida TaxID=112413 RepID=A0ABX0BVS3_9PSEU|nr:MULTISPECIES: YbaB/EbfC family nucleoid-associated protein [Amycolatopsis]MYW94713.1 YbaB/EbfC family DNA-binding protein [Amycolatopsis rubida]NEC59700.1 YbaB/EbfC family nucleoid-associated protein [Amycolatopsis rubida]OAP24549.1 Nucleoid-associated protein YbaB [Amycolatopsis sp. M39]
MSTEMDRLVAEFSKFQTKLEKAQAQFAKVADMQEEVAALEASATSSDGTVTVTAGPSGSVKNIRLTADAYRAAPEALAATILNTLQQAVAAATVEQAEVVDAAVGDAFGLNTTERVLAAQADALGTTPETIQAQLPEPAPEPAAFDPEDVLRDDPKPPPPPPVRRRPAPGEPDDDYFDNDILGRDDRR